MKRLSDVLTIASVAFIIALTVWTSYQLAITARSDVPKFAEAGTYYWEVKQ